MKKKLNIDISEGGNGDMWMRMVSFYAVASLVPKLSIRLYLPNFMRNLAKYTFSDRLEFLDDKEICDIQYTSQGLKHIAAGVYLGKKFIAPYHRSVMLDKERLTLKDRFNITLFNLGQVAGKIYLPPWEVINDYQGYMDIIGLRDLKGVDYPTYLRQLKDDYPSHLAKLNDEGMPTSPELKIPTGIGNNVVVFPNGTSRQFIPVWWAEKYLPNAFYAFYIRDEYAKDFIKTGLKILYYYQEPGDIIALSHAAAWTISTDSFSSHLLQYSTKRCTITTTEVLASRIISPVFQGEVINSVAPCHPCLKMERKTYPTCMAGYTDCISWKSEVYSQNILQSLQLNARNNLHSHV